LPTPNLEDFSSNREEEKKKLFILVFVFGAYVIEKKLTTNDGYIFIEIKKILFNTKSPDSSQ
jgi:hypothetical protein